MILDPSLFANTITILTSLSGGFLVALWVALIIWTNRDSRRRVRNKWVNLLAAILVAVLTIPGIVVYLILRPQKTLEEEYQQTLEEEALLQTIEDRDLCPGCERHVKADWLLCPTCQTNLRKTCLQCGKIMELPWNICPFCSTPVPGMRKESGLTDPLIETKDS